MILRNCRSLMAAMACAAVIGVTGCAGGEVDKAHKQYVADADARTRAIRTPLLLQSAQRYFDTGDLDQAERTVGEALSRDPNSPELHLLAGRIALERGQLERSFQLLDRSIQLGPKEPAPRYYEGLVLQRWEKYDAALKQYHQAYGLAPDNVAYLLAEAEMHVALDRPDDALALLEGKLTYFDQNAGIRVGLGHLYLLKHEYAKAVSSFRQALVLKPDDAQIAENLASAQLAAGQFDGALATLQNLSSQPALAARRDLQAMLATAYGQAGKLPEAKAASLQLTQSDPADDRAWLQLSEVCLSQGDLPGALLAATRVIALTPKSHEGYLVAGLVQQKRGQTAEALKNFDRASELAPQYAAPMIARGLLLEQTGRKTEALQAYREALRREPQDSRAIQLLAGRI